jgi:hypothetical protein
MTGPASRRILESSKEFDDMTPSEMETEIRNLNEWVDEVKQNLPLIATKEDLKACATREDLNAFATKQELADAVARLATKDDVEGAKEYTRLLIATTRGEIRVVGRQVTSLKTDVASLKEDVSRVGGQVAALSVQVAALGPRKKR